MFQQLNIHLIAAMARNHVIGVNNQLPWHIKEDLQHFKNLTMNKIVIMGRKTLESIGRPLPNRKMLAITRQKNDSAKEFDNSFGNFSKIAEFFSSIEEALSYAQTLYEKKLFLPDVYIIGGTQLYSAALEADLVDTMYLTVIDKDFEGDAYFPQIDDSKWRQISEEKRQAVGSSSTEKDFTYRFITLERKREFPPKKELL